MCNCAQLEEKSWSWTQLKLWELVQYWCHSTFKVIQKRWLVVCCCSVWGKTVKAYVFSLGRRHRPALGRDRVEDTGALVVHVLFHLRCIFAFHNLNSTWSWKSFFICTGSCLYSCSSILHQLCLLLEWTLAESFYLCIVFFNINWQTFNEIKEICHICKARDLTTARVMCGVELS